MFHIGIYSPSGNVRDAATLSRAETLLSSLGHRVARDAGVSLADGRFAGSDDERLAAVNRMRDDGAIDLAIPTRGGYGWSRLLPRLDWKRFARDETLWMGHSDTTAFELALYAKTRRVSFAGPMICFDFGAEEPSEFTVSNCFRTLDAYRAKRAIEIRFGDAKPVAPGAKGERFETEGVLWGGNLSMLAHLVGTPYLPDVEGGILFLEEVGEQAYKVERMLYQLWMAGVLQKQRAVLLGAFTGGKILPTDGGYGLNAAFAQIQSVCATPFYTGLPFGHIRDKLTLPVGMKAALSIEEGEATLVLRQ
jgi:muramoyltetrapeptide carboxypeptidase